MFYFDQVEFPEKQCFIFSLNEGKFPKGTGEEFFPGIMETL